MTGATSWADRLAGLSPALSVGILSADLLSLGTELHLLERVGVPLIHVDVMDGCFCPMLTAGPPLVKALRTPLLKDVHLMISEPLDKLESYVAAGADLITVHVEASRHPHRVLQALGQMKNANDPARGLGRGLALNPGTPLDVVVPLLDEVDIVCLLAVNPGWGGQKFISATESRMEKLRAMISAAGRRVAIGVDGGITRDNIGRVARMGANVIVTGSAVFDGKNAEANARGMLEAVAQGRPI
jgi:ribulose-phosphate 3-epimerase